MMLLDLEQMDLMELTWDLELWREKYNHLQLVKTPMDPPRIQREIQTLQVLIKEASEALVNGGKVPWKRCTRRPDH